MPLFYMERSYFWAICSSSSVIKLFLFDLYELDYSDDISIF